MAIKIKLINEDPTYYRYQVFVDNTSSPLGLLKTMFKYDILFSLISFLSLLFCIILFIVSSIYLNYYSDFLLQIAIFSGMGLGLLIIIIRYKDLVSYNFRYNRAFFMNKKIIFEYEYNNQRYRSVIQLNKPMQNPVPFGLNYIVNIEK